MDFEFLHVAAGDKKKKIDTSTAEGRAEAGELVKSMLAQGTTIFLERGKKTYRVKGYDAATDSLIVDMGPKTVRAAGAKSKVTGVPAVRGGAQ